MILDKQLLDNLCQQAQTSPRLRMNYDLRTTSNDSSQRILNASEPGTDIPIHPHRDTSDTVVMLRGSVKEIFYTIEGGTAYPTAEFILKAGSDNCALQIPQGQWHSLECLEAHSVLFEAKDGAFVPRTDDDVFIPQT